MRNTKKAAAFHGRTKSVASSEGPSVAVGRSSRQGAGGRRSLRSGRGGGTRCALESVHDRISPAIARGAQLLHDLGLSARAHGLLPERGELLVALGQGHQAQLIEEATWIAQHPFDLGFQVC